jgi:hypothetical protein
MLLLIVGAWSIRSRAARWAVLLGTPLMGALFLTHVMFPRAPSFYMATPLLTPRIRITPMEWAGWWYLYLGGLVGALAAERRPRWLLFWQSAIAAGICLAVEQMGSSIGFWWWHVLQPNDPSYGNPVYDRVMGWAPFPVGHALFGWAMERSIPVGMLLLSIVTLIKTRSLWRFGRLLALMFTTSAVLMFLGVRMMLGTSILFLAGAMWLFGRLLESDLGAAWESLAPQRNWPIVASYGVVITVCVVLLAANGYADRSLLVLPLAAATLAVGWRAARRIDGRADLR